MSIERKKDKRVSRLWESRFENEMVKTFKKEMQHVIDLKLPSEDAFAKIKNKIMKEIDGISPEYKDVTVAAESELKERLRSRKKDIMKLAKKLNKKDNLKNKTHII